MIFNLPLPPLKLFHPILLMKARMILLKPKSHLLLDFVLRTTRNPNHWGAQVWSICLSAYFSLLTSHAVPLIQTDFSLSLLFLS